MASSSQMHLLPTLFLLALAMLFSPSQPATCASQQFSGNRTYAFCTDLPVLSAALHWTYDEARSGLSVAFVAPPAGPDGWIAWAINPTPTGSGMRGSQALVAFRDAEGKMTVQAFNISSYGLPAPGGAVWFEVEESASEFSGGVMTLFAELVLPVKGITVVKHVWQVGGAVDGGNTPEEHGAEPDNLSAMGSLDLLNGGDGGGGGGGRGGGGGGDSRIKKRNVHGLLNVISWGIMFPSGIIIARYLSVFPSADPVWFYLHVLFQVSAYAIGVAGWGTGLKLGHQSEGISHPLHRNLGITLFALATLQIFALVFRPGKDHKYRPYWNIYHRVIGYSIVVLAIINVFKGFEILRPQQKWRSAYIVVIAVLGGIATFLEAITWIVVLRRKKKSSTLQNKP